MGPPPGFTRDERGNRTFFFRSDLHAEVERLGLADPLRWQALLERGAGSTGRGATLRVEAGAGRAWILKQLRRGGLLASLWRERHLGRQRLLDNLALPLEAARRGIPTAAPVALLILEGPPGLLRGWLATEEIQGALDLGSRLAISPAPGEREVRAALSLVRSMHDAGIEHRDLNLGNLLLRTSAAGEVQPFVVDLDGAVLHARPLRFSARQSALRRLERSYVKGFGASAPLRALGPCFWYALYAGTDARLARRLERGRTVGRVLLALHRLGWREPAHTHTEPRRSRGE